MHFMEKKWPVFYPILIVSLGANRNFDDVPVTVSGFSFALKEPVMIAEKLRSRLPGDHASGRGDRCGHPADP